MGLRKPIPHEPLREVVQREPERDLPGLLRQLRTGNVAERRWAARDLVEHPEAASALGDQLSRELDSSVREAALTTLGAMASADVVNAMLPLLRSEDPQLRNGAIEVLTHMPDAVGPKITVLLQDPDPDVRIFTVNLLGDLQHEHLNSWLAQVLKHEDQINVVAAAVEVLAEVGTSDIVPALQEAARRFGTDPFLGFAVNVAIERIESV